MLDVWPSDCEEMNWCCFKPLNLWQLAVIAVGHEHPGTVTESRVAVFPVDPCWVCGWVKEWTAPSFLLQIIQSCPPSISSTPRSVATAHYDILPNFFPHLKLWTTPCSGNFFHNQLHSHLLKPFCVLFAFCLSCLSWASAATPTRITPLTGPTATSKLMSSYFCGGSTMQILALSPHCERQNMPYQTCQTLRCLWAFQSSSSSGKNVECPQDFRVWPKKANLHWPPVDLEHLDNEDHGLSSRVQGLQSTLPGAWVVSTVAVKLFSRISIF